MSNSSAVEATHLDDLDDGCGCAEVWEALSERRRQAGTEAAESADAVADD